MPEKKESGVMADNRIVYMQGEFNEDKAEKIVTAMLEFERKDPSKDIVIFIDSYGGHVHSFFTIHDVIRNLLRCDVATVCVGKAMSCGQMLLISGARGKRFITPYSRIMMHEISSGTIGKLSEIENDLDENKRLLKIWRDLIVRYTKIGKEQLEAILRKDCYLSAEQALKHGLVDRVIRVPTDLYRYINI